MTGLRLRPIRTAEAEAYWRVFLAGRSDVPTRDLRFHLDRFLSLPQEEQRSHLAVLRDARIVGTVRLLPGTITGFSMDPAERGDARAAVLKALDLLRSQSPGPVTANFEDTYRDAFDALGFRPVFERMRMEGPTAKGSPPGGPPFRHPEEAEIVELPALLQDVYEGHLEQGFGMHVGGGREWRGYVTGILRGESGRFMPDASFVASEGQRLIAAVLTTHWMGMPLVAELGVARDRRGRGLGRALMVAASDRLAALGESSWSLYVTVGNDPAIRLYESLGFRQAGGRTVTARLEGDSQP